MSSYGKLRMFAFMRMFIKYFLTVLLLLCVTDVALCAQDKRKKDKTGSQTQELLGPQRPEKMTPQQYRNNIMEFVVEGNDTLYIGSQLPAARIYERLSRQKGKDWRKFYRLVHNFSKVYPYALVARKLVAEADSTITADNMKRGKKEKYISTVQDELFDAFETPLRKLTVSQGALLMRLIDREVGKSTYHIIKDYKTGIAAGFWQGIAKMCGTDLKAPYDPDGIDYETEELVKIWEAGEFEGLYYSLFGKFPEMPKIPDEYK